MNWVKFMKVDMRLMKCQRMVLLGIPLLSVIVGIAAREATFLVTYMCFGVLIISSTSFLVESKNVSTFIELLPGTDTEKVAGRFAGFLAMLLAAVLFGVGASSVLGKLGYLPMRGADYYLCIAITMFGIFVGSIQMTVLYVFGRSKRGQALNLLRIIPPILFFFGANYASDFIAEDGERIREVIRFVNGNRGGLIAVGALVSFAFYAAAIAVSALVIRRRDIE